MSKQSSRKAQNKSRQQRAIEAELLQQQQRLQLFSEVTLNIRQSLQLKEILRATVTEVQRILQVDRVLIYQVLPDGTGKAISEAVLPDYPALMNLEFPEEVFPEDYQQRYAQGRVRAISDVHDPEFGLADCLVEFVKQFSIQSKLIVPIVQTGQNDRLWGLLIAHQCCSPRKWVEFELELMQQLADQISIAIAQAQLLEHLEEVVEARTVELKEANYHLQQEIKVRKQAEAALQQRISDREAIERMKDEFISVISHELRTPLTSLHSALKILATGRLGNLSSDGQQMLAIADESTERLVRLVNNVLDLQRIESGKVVMDLQACKSANLLTQAAEVMQAMAQQHEVALVTQAEEIPVWADADYILQTLTNLISNAIKFSFPNGTVWLSVAQRSPSEVVFQVRDEGQGIPSDHLERIFERFLQVDSSDSRKKGGTGLGLAICRKIIEQHKGRIWAESISGKGSTFAFTLPILTKKRKK